MVQDLLEVEGDGTDNSTFDTPLLLLVAGAVIVVFRLVLLGFKQLSRQERYDAQGISSQRPDELRLRI